MKFVFYLSIYILSVSASLANQSIEDVKKWAPAHIQANEHLAGLRDLCNMEAIAPIKHDDTSGGTDFGCNFPHISSIHRECLSEIKKRYDESGTPVSVADLAAGMGCMTWKMIVAGGFVRAVEL